jgi:hypothetical protein
MITQLGREELTMSHLRRWRTMTTLFFLIVLLCTGGACSRSEKSKALVKIANVKLTHVGGYLQVTLDYELEPEVTLPLPYKELLVFPLEPGVQLAGTLQPLLLHLGSVAVSLEIPADAGIDWDGLRDKESCCMVSLKGLVQEAGQKPRYERISNQVHVGIS